MSTIIIIIKIVINKIKCQFSIVTIISHLLHPKSRKRSNLMLIYIMEKLFKKKKKKTIDVIDQEVIVKRRKNKDQKKGEILVKNKEKDKNKENIMMEIVIDKDNIEEINKEIEIIANKEIMSKNIDKRKVEIIKINKDKEIEIEIIRKSTKKIDQDRNLMKKKDKKNILIGDDYGK